MDQNKLIQLTIKKMMQEATSTELAALDELITKDAISSFFVQTITDYFSREHQRADADASRLFKSIKEKNTHEKK